MDYIIGLCLMLACFALGWQARDIKQEKLEDQAHWEQYERPCTNVDPTYGACTNTGIHTFHNNGLLFWSGGSNGT